MKKKIKKLIRHLSLLLILSFFCKDVVAKDIPDYQAKSRLHSFMRTYVKRNNIDLPAAKLTDYLNQASQLIEQRSLLGKIDTKKVALIENDFRDFLKAEYPTKPRHTYTKPHSRLIKTTKTTVYRKPISKKKTTTPKPTTLQRKTKPVSVKIRKPKVTKKYYPKKKHTPPTTPKRAHTPKRYSYTPKKKYIPTKKHVSKKAKQHSKKSTRKKPSYKPKKATKRIRIKKGQLRKRYIPKKKAPTRQKKTRTHLPHETTVTYGEIKVRRQISKARVPKQERLRVFNNIMSQVRAHARDGKIARDTLKSIIDKELLKYRTTKIVSPSAKTTRTIKRRK